LGEKKKVGAEAPAFGNFGVTRFRAQEKNSQKKGYEMKWELPFFCYAGVPEAHQNLKSLQDGIVKNEKFGRRGEGGAVFGRMTAAPRSMEKADCLSRGEDRVGDRPQGIAVLRKETVERRPTPTIKRRGTSSLGQAKG